ncbi:uncharacterized protein [Typha latifolia]|uniref:uncharacterized protein n=1 Tax=Typha latifolia TaxID=4733 RepID=UPI003C2FC84B
MASASGAAESTDGPVLSVVSKRLRALRKKLNRILQMEESLAQGKPLNKEQEEVLRSKPIVASLIDELEKLRLPLSAAISEELSRAASPPPPPSPPKEAPETADVEDLVSLLYFGCLFDVKPQSEFTATMLTRTHERGCCLTYDYVTDDATDLLGERDLDAISALGALVTSRPACVGVSHKDALRGCVEHARLWISKSDQPIHPDSTVTYDGLREKLKKILASDYFTTTPEMKAPVDVAAAVGKYGGVSQVQISDADTVPAPSVETVGDQENFHKKDEQEAIQATEVHVDHQSASVDASPKDDEDSLNPTIDVASSPKEQLEFEADAEDHSLRDTEPKDQQHIPRRPYQNQRGGSRGWGRRGYENGRGGRGGRGGGGSGYQNGRGQHYDIGYYPRSYYNNRGRRGRPGGPAMYNNHGGPNEGHVSPGVELGANA